MKLREKQSRFALHLGMLLLEIEKRGYECTLGDAYRDPRLHGPVGVKLGYGAAKSCHKLRLAIDLNLFKDGVLLKGQAADVAHIELHNWWVSNCQGGAIIPGDANHYSFLHEGMR